MGFQSHTIHPLLCLESRVYQATSYLIMRRSVTLLRRNIDLFAWAPYDMPGNDTILVYHFLIIDPTMKSVSQMKFKVGEEKRVTIDEEVHKLMSHVYHISYQTNVACLSTSMNLTLHSLKIHIPCPT